MGTPWYVYLVIIYIVKISPNIIKGGSIHMKKLVILPAVFLCLSFNEIFYTNTSTEQIIVWVLSLLFGAYILGWLPYQRIRVTPAKTPHTLYVPGSWWSLALIIVTFIIKYAIGALTSMHHAFSAMELYGLLLLSGVFTGAFVGRLAYGIYKLYFTDNLHYNN